MGTLFEKLVENATSKVNSRCLKLYRAYSISCIRHMLANRFVVGFQNYQSSGKEKERFVFSHVLDKTKLGTFTL